VLPRISYAKFVEGAISDAAVGSICRRIRTKPVPIMPGRPSPVVETSSGGVRLPTDSRGDSTMIRKK